MNLSSIISNLKMDTGLAFISLPIDDLDKRISDVIRDRTLNTFNQYFPERVTESMDLSNFLCISQDFSHSVFEIPEIRGRIVIGVEDIRVDSRSTNGGFFDPVSDFSIGTYSDMMMAQVSADLVSLAAPPVTFHFEHPNVLHVYNMGTIGYKILFDVLLGHSSNLSSIPFSVEESFYELALLDFKRFCYNSLKHFNEINTVNGTINLRIDDWANAESERKDLLRDWDTKFHLDRKQVYYI